MADRSEGNDAKSVISYMPRSCRHFAPIDRDKVFAGRPLRCGPPASCRNPHLSGVSIDETKAAIGRAPAKQAIKGIAAHSQRIGAVEKSHIVREDRRGEAWGSLLRRCLSPDKTRLTLSAATVASPIPTDHASFN
jgi:hypothetical protein